jgi:cell filamentation protein
MSMPEKTLTEADYAKLAVAEPKLSVNGLLELHKQLFGESHDRSGQIREMDLSWDGLYFAYPSLIMGSLAHRFEAFGTIDMLKSLNRDVFFDALAYHVSELHAISPFGFGNRRVLALHAEQIARAVGYAIKSCVAHRNLWDEALSLGFVHNDHRAIACLLKSAPIPVDFFPESLIGFAGLPTLPDRDMSLKRRYLRTISRARDDLEDYIHEARDEAMAEYIRLTREEAPMAQRTRVYHELAFLRHPKGPLFQVALLSAINYGTITPAIHNDQNPLGYVREIAAAIIAAIGQQPRLNLEYLIETVHVPMYSGGGSPHQDRLASQFLNHTQEQNYADQRFAACQRAVDEKMAKSKHVRKTDLDRMATQYDRACRSVAARIRVGDMMLPNVSNNSYKRFKEVG